MCRPRWVWGINRPQSMKHAGQGVYLGFETLSAHHQKSKTKVPVSPLEWLMSSNFFSKRNFLAGILIDSKLFMIVPGGPNKRYGVGRQWPPSIRRTAAFWRAFSKWLKNVWMWSLDQEAILCFRPRGHLQNHYKDFKEFLFLFAGFVSATHDTYIIFLKTQ